MKNFQSKKYRKKRLNDKIFSYPDNLEVPNVFTVLNNASNVNFIREVPCIPKKVD